MGTSVDSGLYDLHFISHSCDEWPGNPIDFYSQTHFIYAVKDAFAEFPKASVERITICRKDQSTWDFERRHVYRRDAEE